MARPSKQGLEYFSLDVDCDDKVELLEAKHGVAGFGILIKLWQKIYKDGYFITWDEEKLLLFKKQVSVDINLINDVINDCFRWNIFDSALYKKYGILTSRGIQKRFLFAIGRRANVDFVKEYQLVDIESDNINLVSAYNNGPNCNSNEAESVVDVELMRTETLIQHEFMYAESTQSKVKKSIVKESIENQSAGANIFDGRSFSPQMQDRIQEWLDYKKERRETYKPTGLKNLLTQIENNLKLHTEDEVMTLISNCMASNYKGIIWNKLGPAQPQRISQNLTGIEKLAHDARSEYQKQYDYQEDDIIDIQ